MVEGGGWRAEGGGWRAEGGGKDRGKTLSILDRVAAVEPASNLKSESIEKGLNPETLMKRRVLHSMIFPSNITAFVH